MGRIRLLLISVVAALFSVATIGCDGNVHVSGKVTYPNGQPLTRGKVVFTDDFYMGKSDIDKNGEYSIHTLKRNDGIKKGVYQVYICGAMRFEPTEEIKDSLQGYRFDKGVDLIDDQHTNPDTSGWRFEVKKDCKINLTVYPPGEVPEDQRTEEAKYMFDLEYRKKVDREKMKEFRDNQSRKRRTVNPKLL